MFSDMPREHYKEELAQHQEGVLDIIQRAGINVLWNDNDGGCKGACDRVPHQNVTALNLPGQCINGECYDEVLFHGLEEYINNLQGDGVIVLHTIGSHGPTYYTAIRRSSGNLPQPATLTRSRPVPKSNW